MSDEQQVMSGIDLSQDEMPKLLTDTIFGWLDQPTEVDVFVTRSHRLLSNVTDMIDAIRDAWKGHEGNITKTRIRDLKRAYRNLTAAKTVAKRLRKVSFLAADDDEEKDSSDDDSSSVDSDDDKGPVPPATPKTERTVAAVRRAATATMSLSPDGENDDWPQVLMTVMKEHSISSTNPGALALQSLLLQAFSSDGPENIRRLLIAIRADPALVAPLRSEKHIVKRNTMFSAVASHFRRLFDRDSESHSQDLRDMLAYYATQTSFVATIRAVEDETTELGQAYIAFKDERTAKGETNKGQSPTLFVQRGIVRDIYAHDMDKEELDQRIRDLSQYCKVGAGLQKLESEFGAGVLMLLSGTSWRSTLKNFTNYTLDIILPEMARRCPMLLRVTDRANRNLLVHLNSGKYENIPKMLTMDSMTRKEDLASHSLLELLSEPGSVSADGEDVEMGG